MADLVAHSSIGSITYLAPSGSLGEHNTQAALAGAVDACVETSRAEVVLDLDRVPLVNGRGLEVILEANDRLMAAGGSFKFVNASPLVTDIFIANGITSFDPASAFGANTVTSAGQRLAPQLKKIGEILIEMGLIDDAQCAEALQLQAKSGKQLGAILVERRTISEADLYKALSRQSGIPYIALRPGLYEPAAAAMVPAETARRLNVLPMFMVRDTLTLAIAEPQAIPALDEIQSITGGKLCLVLSRREDISRCHFDAYSADQALRAMDGGIPVQFLESGVILRVVPSVDQRGRVKLQVQPEVSTASLAAGIPSKRSTQVTTELICEDGQSIFIGGLMRARGTIERAGVPLLRDVPVIGNLFSSSSEATATAETVVIITPYIIRKPLDAAKESEEKMRQIDKASGLIMDLQLKLERGQPQP